MPATVRLGKGTIARVRDIFVAKKYQETTLLVYWYFAQSSADKYFFDSEKERDDAFVRIMEAMGHE